MVATPHLALLLVDLAQAAPRRVLADHTLQSQKLRQYRVTAQRRHVGIAPMPSQNRQQHRAKYVPLGGRVRAAVVERTVRHPRVKQPCCFQILDKKRDVAQRRRRAFAVPFNLHSAGVGVDLHPATMHPLINRRSLTHKVCDHLLKFGHHSQQNQPSQGYRQVSNSRI